MSMAPNGEHLKITQDNLGDVYKKAIDSCPGVIEDPSPAPSPQAAKHRGELGIIENSKPSPMEKTPSQKRHAHTQGEAQLSQNHGSSSSSSPAHNRQTTPASDGNGTTPKIRQSANTTVKNLVKNTVTSGFASSSTNMGEFGGKDQELWARKSVVEALGGDDFKEKLMQAMQDKEEAPDLDDEWKKGIVYSWNLVFRQKEVEHIYIICFSRRLAKRWCGPMCFLLLYAVYSISEGIWSGSGKNYATSWDHPAQKAFNATWFIVGVYGFFMAIFLFMHSKGFFRESRKCEYMISIGCATLFWPGIYFGNRWRCSQLWGADPDDIFGGYQGDAELLLLFDAIISYIVIFTPLRLASTALIVISMILGFISSTAICGSSPKGDSSASVAVATMLYILALMEQKVVENLKRQQFYRTYRAQRDNIAQITQGAMNGGTASITGSSGLSDSRNTAASGLNRSTMVVSSTVLASRVRGGPHQKNQASNSNNFDTISQG